LFRRGCSPGWVTDWDEDVSAAADLLSRDFRAALSEVEQASERVYYDAEADQAAAAAYYDGVGLEQLSELVASTHHTMPRYKPSLEVYPWVDLQPEGDLRSLYTGERFAALELIEADFAVIQERVQQLARMQMFTQESSVAMESQVEEALPFNCEHVVPQSWFAKAEPMRGDLHHLFACESRCNSFRGNTPFAEFTDFPPPASPGGVEAMDAVRNDCGKTAPAGFEPVHGKGAAARASFYFRLRYPDHISEDELSSTGWEVLLAWHEQDPVTEWELHRNAAIFERQGNRNPFIDHPEWVPDVLVMTR
jgi:endonuclease I